MASSPPPGDSFPAALPPRIVFYDGVCGLCTRSVRFLVRVDRQRALHYAPLQGETAAHVLQLMPAFPDHLDTLVFLDDSRLYFRMTAWLELARYLPLPWRAAAWFRWLPEWLTNPVYATVARFRYRIFGRRDLCQIPSPEERTLFLP